MNQEIIELTSLISSVMQGLIAIGTFLLAFVVWRGSKKIAKAEYTRSIQESWITANIAVLQSEKLCKLAYQMTNPNLEFKNIDDEDYYTKKYLKFLYLNIIESTFIGKNNGLIDKEFSDEISNDLLISLLSHTENLNQIDSGGFSTAFVKHCKSIVLKLNEIK